MLLLSALEAVFLMLAAFSPSVGDYLVIAGEHGARMASKQGTQWLLGTAFASLVILTAMSPMSKDLQTMETPYSLLGVTTRSSSGDIANAYRNIVQKTQVGIQLGTLADVNQLQAYHQAYEILLDPLQRCVYHRDSNAPDWYGVPTFCWAELAVDRLRTAKKAVRAWSDGGAVLTNTAGAFRLLKERFGRATGTTPGSRETTPEHFWARQRAAFSKTRLQCLDWLKSALGAPLLRKDGQTRWWVTGIPVVLWKIPRQCRDWLSFALLLVLLAIKIIQWFAVPVTTLWKTWRKCRDWLRATLAVLSKVGQIKDWAASNPLWIALGAVALFLTSVSVTIYLSRDRIITVSPEQKTTSEEPSGRELVVLNSA